MKELEVHGASIEEAIEKGLQELKLAREEVEIKILDEGKTGLFGLIGADPAKVIIRKREETRTDLPEDKQITKKIKDVIERVIKLMHLDNMDVIVQYRDGIYNVNINGSDKKLLIGKQGQTLAALQLLIPLMLFGKDTIKKQMIEIDIDEYVKQKLGKIIELAMEMANRVKSSGISDSLKPMSAKERMTVHKTLKNVEGITTVSEGTGDSRRVLIKLK